MNHLVVANFLTIIVILMLALKTTNATVTDFGNGNLYKEYAIADCTLRGSSNFNYQNYLIVSKHPGYPKTRSLVQFNISDVPFDCNVVFAKMYLNFWYAYKSSSSNSTVQDVPYLSRQLQVHQVKQEWVETEVTSFVRKVGSPWSVNYLAIDGTHASSHVLDSVGVFTGRPSGYVEFDVTVAVKNWLVGEPNHGLLVWDTTEQADGRDIRFYSREQSDPNCRPLLNVFCSPRSFVCPCSTCPTCPSCPACPLCPTPQPTIKC